MHVLTYGSHGLGISATSETGSFQMWTNAPHPFTWNVVFYLNTTRWTKSRNSVIRIQIIMPVLCKWIDFIHKKCKHNSHWALSVQAEKWNCKPSLFRMVWKSSLQCARQHVSDFSMHNRLSFNQNYTNPYLMLTTKCRYCS